MSQPVIEFWSDFGSSYAYFASLEVEALAEKHWPRGRLAALHARNRLRGHRSAGALPYASEA
jgi:2-hydroxychromene-2-carboxylate isomerase